MKKQIYIFITIMFALTFSVHAQWSFNGTHIHNSNTGNVGIGISTPASLLDVAQNTTEPMISVRNLGGSGGATYSMFDQASGADWKFKATTTGGFKIRDHAFGLDVIQIEANSAAQVLYINAAGNVGLGDNTPAAKLTVGSGDKFQVEATNGNVTFTDDLASIKFPNSTTPNNPMIYLFSSGTFNADRMIIGHSPSFPKWGIEYHDTSDVIYFRDSGSRKFSFELGSGHFGVGTEDPAYPIDIEGRMRIKSSGNLNNSPGIWFAALDNEFDRSFFGMSEPDSVIGIYSQHLGKWAIEFEIMREPRIGVNIPDGSPPRAEVHLYHTNFGGANDGIRIQNEGSNAEYWNLYTSNTTGDFEFYSTGIKRATIDDVSGVYTAISDARMKTNINNLEEVLPAIMKLQPRTYQFTSKPSNRYYTGFLAQELEQVFPQFVYYGGDDQVTYSVDYASMSVIALKAIQEQQGQIEELKREIEELKALMNK